MTGARASREPRPLMEAALQPFSFSQILAIADALPMPIALVDPGLHYRFCNSAFAEFFGLSRAEVLKRCVGNLLPPAAHEARKPMFEAALKGERQWFAATYDHPQRGRLALQTEYVPQVKRDGTVQGIVIIVQDVTEQRVAERALRESEERFRRIADSAPVLMWVTRKDRKHEFVNEAFLEFCGLNAEQVGSSRWRDWIHPDDFDRIVAETLAGEAILKPFTLEARYRRFDGEWRWLRSVSRPRFGPDGELLGFIGAAIDVTVAKKGEEELRALVEERTAELHGTQAQLRQSQKMEALGQLTGGIAHDFNNLLTVVVGGLDLIAQRETDEKLQRYARNALEAAERGARLTAQLLAFSRVQRMEVRPTCVAPLIENMRPLLRNVLGPGISKKFDLDHSLGPILADPTQLELAVLNLAINARDAMPDGGVLTFRTEMTTVTGDPELEDGEYIKLSIDDSGMGMSPEVIERAFEPFFTTKEVGKGTGLGLSMVYGVARQSGGTARITSTPGEGTCVQLYFRKAPDCAVVEAARGDKDRTSREPLGASVLVIDDDPDVREFVAATLGDLGYSVTDAADGASGLAVYRKQRCDVVILDFLMPGMSGADVAREIRKIEPAQPILFVSGYSETEAIRQSAPGASMIAKPFRAEALDDAVREVLGAAQAAA